MIVSRDEILEYLRRGECAVKFMKRNGEERLMACTLNRKLMLPQNLECQRCSNASADDDRIIVWDLDKEAFRSFRLQSIIWVMAPEKEDAVA